MSDLRIHTGYLEMALTPTRLRKVVRDTVKALRPHKHEFEAIACRGVSGTLVAPLVALRLDKPLIVVRKGEACHTWRQAEGALEAKSYCIVDDLISTGDTVASTIKAINDYVATHIDPLAPIAGRLPQCWGVALYDEQADRHFPMPKSIQALGVTRRIGTRTTLREAVEV